MDRDYISTKATASDFSDFVYCGLNWAYDQDRKYDRIKELKSQCYDTSQKKRNRELGQENEYKCVEWVMSKYSLSEQHVIFNGTGKNNPNNLTASFDYLQVMIECKPDLIIKNKNLIELFEFKSVGDYHYLDLPELESYHAQVWCYERIHEFRVDNYYLFRYFIDPLQKLNYQKLYRCKLILHSKTDDNKFQGFFEAYIQALRLSDKGDPRIISLIEDYAPKSEDEKQQKCTHCIYKNINVCRLYKR